MIIDSVVLSSVMETSCLKIENTSIVSQTTMIAKQTYLRVLTAPATRTLAASAASSMGRNYGNFSISNGLR
ncbi:hypothetical protein SAMN04515647_3428 [Cohaesibacter sp. ES.047]|uniref:hypothetical protein n=1 Tax=Cohaesibacter sp. ES.047 TaxID=1798205 RepID=UPI000BB992AF|nr:hypothetical protein [Cohaesibacter sp. ES.047]SNY93146.1 hypothetical protein SAMN04515647_3428 [Cohaesibacter sp. ES.047]